MHDVRPFLPAPFEEPGALLYVGYRPDACAWLPELHDAGNEVTVLEIWRTNAEDATHDLRVTGHCWLGDVRDVQKIPMAFDYIWWWHGPEHVEKAEFPGVLELLCGKARRLVAVASPWGLYEQGEHGGNPHERHRWSVTPADFEALGMEVRTDGAADQPGSEVVGWKSLVSGDLACCGGEC